MNCVLRHGILTRLYYLSPEKEIDLRYDYSCKLSLDESCFGTLVRYSQYKRSQHH